MLILKNSFLDPHNDLVKILLGGSYGIYKLSTKQIVVPPVYDYIHEFKDGRAVVRKGPDTWYEHVFGAGVGEATQFLEIDFYGNEYRDNPGLKAEYSGIIEKGDDCPDCTGGGCATCCGYGFIPPGGDHILD